MTFVQSFLDWAPRVETRLQVMCWDMKQIKMTMFISRFDPKPNPLHCGDIYLQWMDEMNPMVDNAMDEQFYEWARSILSQEAHDGIPDPNDDGIPGLDGDAGAAGCSVDWSVPHPEGFNVGYSMEIVDGQERILEYIYMDDTVYFDHYETDEGIEEDME